MMTSHSTDRMDEDITPWEERETMNIDPAGTISSLAAYIETLEKEKAALLAALERFQTEPCRNGVQRGIHCAMLPAESCPPCQARAGIRAAKGEHR